MIKAEIIADSLNEHGQRLTTFVLVFPRIVLAEFNTHRMLSRNSASSRAIPFEKMLKMVQENPFIPIKWMKDHKGMQGAEYFEDENFTIPVYSTDSVPLPPYETTLTKEWLKARDRSVFQAKMLSDAGLTKQFCNRLLEPFMWHTVIVTGTEWENFFALRADDQAEIHIQDLAHKMLTIYNESNPKQLKAGDWHIPFGSKMDVARILPIFEKLGERPGDRETDKMRVRIATARCARVSYLNFEGKDDYEADIRLHDILLKSGHMSPFEHCARAMSEDEFKAYRHLGVVEEIDKYQPQNQQQMLSYGWCGNFRGFVQYRKTITGENRTDNRVKRHEKTN